MSNIEAPTSERRRLSVIISVVVIVALAASAIVLSQTSSPASSIAVPGYRCAPYTAFPTLRLGHHASVTETFDGYKATFRATSTKQDSISYGPNGMPFTGDLTVSRHGRSWTLPRASDTKDFQIDDLCVVRFTPGTTPGVLVEGYTGGAHCCELPVLYAYDRSSGDYVKALDMTPNNYESSLAFDNNGGFRPRLVGTRVLLQSEDDHFAYTFGCYACTPMPMVLDDFNGGVLRSVTKKYPAIIEAEAASFLKSATLYAKGERSPSLSGIGPFGALAAWVADECAVGHGANAWLRVLAFQRAGELSNKTYYADSLIKGSYVTQLHHFLLAGGYCTGQIN